MIKNKEYTASLIFCSSHKHLEEKDFLENFKDFYPDSTMGHEILSQLEKFYAWTIFNDIYENRRFTSAIYMCAIAVAMGYKGSFIWLGLIFITPAQLMLIRKEKISRVFLAILKNIMDTLRYRIRSLRIIKRALRCKNLIAFVLLVL